MADYPQQVQSNHRRAWDVLKGQELIHRPPWLRVIQEHVRLPNQVEIPDYYRVEMPGFVNIFAVTPDHQVVTIEQYRHGPGVVSIELPAGGFDGKGASDDPLETAKRELMEETGMSAGRWTLLGKFFVDANRGCGWMYAFLAEEATAQQSPAPEPTEIHMVRLQSLDAVRKLWFDGSISNMAASALVGLALAHLEQTR
ncbi:MAG: NUDIX hydrolase [Chloroflexi bacterium]|nr:NUDIX hydrolase [Chloroflexota bacterium]